MKNSIYDLEDLERLELQRFFLLPTSPERTKLRRLRLRKEIFGSEADTTMADKVMRDGLFCGVRTPLE